MLETKFKHIKYWVLHNLSKVICNCSKLNTEIYPLDKQLNGLILINIKLIAYCNEIHVV